MVRSLFTHRRTAAAAAWALLYFVAPAPAQVTFGGGAAGTVGDTLTVTLAEAQRLALSQNPEFLAERQEVAIAAGQLRQARVLAFNPEFELRAPGAATAGFQEYEAFLGQEIEWGGQRGARIAAASLGVQRADAVVTNAARETLADVTAAYYSMYAAQRRLAVARELASLNEQLLSATRIQVAEGEISVLEANLAEIEVGRAHARVFQTEREATSARLELQRLTGLEPSVVLSASDQLPPAPASASVSLDSLLALATARRPDLTAQSLASRQADALTRLARREAIPNLRIGAVAERTEGEGSPRVGIGVTVPIPAWNRNQGTIAERDALASQASLNLRAAELAVRTEVTEAVRAYQSASDEQRLVETTVLARARQNQALLETAYRAGKIDLATLLLVRNQLLDAELGYWEAWLAHRRALVQLEAATASLGGDLELTTAVPETIP